MEPQKIPQTGSKKKDLAFLPPPEYFKKKKNSRQANLSQWKAQSVLKFLPPRQDRQELQSLDELDDFSSLLTKRLFENLEEGEGPRSHSLHGSMGHFGQHAGAGNLGSYTLKEGSYCLVIQDRRRGEDPPGTASGLSGSLGVLTSREADKKAKHFEEMLPGPCYGLHIKRTSGGNGSGLIPGSGFKREEILKFESIYKDILYDTHIKIGRFYQAFIPEMQPCRVFLKSMVVYGLPPKDTGIIRPPKLSIEYTRHTKNKKPAVQSARSPQTQVISVDPVSEKKQPDSPMAHQTAEESVPPNNPSGEKSQPEERMNEEIPPEDKSQEKKDSQKAAEDVSVSTSTSYVRNDDFKGEAISENFYVPRRSLGEYLEWDPELTTDPEVVDMMNQVLEEFKGDSRVSKETLLDYLKLCRLNKERFLDHLEQDHDDFRKFMFMILHKGT